MRSSHSGIDVQSSDPIRDTAQKCSAVPVETDSAVAPRQEGNALDSTGLLAEREIGPAKIKTGSRADFIYHRLLAVSDVLAICLAAFASAAFFTLNDREFDLTALAVTVALMVPVWFVIAYGAGLYHVIERHIDYNYVDELSTVVVASTAWCWLFVLVRSLVVNGGTEIAVPAVMWILMVPLLLVGRALVRRHARRRKWNRRLVATIGDEAGVASLTQRIERHSEWGLDVKLTVQMNSNQEFLVQDDGEEGSIFAIRSPDSVEIGAEGYRAPTERILAEAIEAAGVDRAIIAGEFQDLYSRTRLIHELIERGVSVDHISGGPETLYSKAVFHDLEGLPVLSVSPTAPRPLARWLKRAIDICLSTVGLILTSPIILWAVIWIKLDSKGPVLYRQSRCGLNGEEFQLLKLRTMVDGAHEMRESLRREAESAGNGEVLFKLSDDPRITKAGRTLRALSIDELPQLWNVLKGDMSMVGPRPLVFEEALKATDLFSARTRMKPGIAGPWQALGRSSIPFEDMIKLDYAYVVGWSMSEDVKLLLRTTAAVVTRKGAL